MLKVRKAGDRGAMNIGWLDAKYTFSFARYYDPEWMGFGPLRVMNEDFIAGNTGFPEHEHANMEILTYVLEGQLSHKDSMGNGSSIKAGELQMMSAGSGITHSEFNDGDATTHSYQIWLLPNEENAPPRYHQKKFDIDYNNLHLVASPDGKDESFQIRQDVNLYIGKFDKEQTMETGINKNRKYWIQIMEGDVTINGMELTGSDGIGLTDEEELHFTSHSDAHILFFDMPA